MAWIIEAICLTEDARRSGKNAHYRYHVRGLNTEHPVPESFAWAVPNVDDLRFDKSQVTIPCPLCGDRVLACELPEHGGNFHEFELAGRRMNPEDSVTPLFKVAQ